MAFTSLKENSFFTLRSVGLKGSNILSMLRGEHPLAVFENVASQEMCNRIADAFFQSRLLQHRDDGVPGLNMGAFHFDKTIDTYLNEVLNARKTLRKVLTNDYPNIMEIHAILANLLYENGISYRPAQHQDQKAGEFVLRSWDGQGKYALLPHEDCAQLTDPKQIGFEVQKVAEHTMLGFNLCVCEPKAGGEIIIWNSIPDQATRVSLGVTNTGYPYPADVVNGVPFVGYMPKKGDLYCVNGNCLHAVNNSSSFRLTISFNCGSIDEETAVYWT